MGCRKCHSALQLMRDLSFTSRKLRDTIDHEGNSMDTYLPWGTPSQSLLVNQDEREAIDSRDFCDGQLPFLHNWIDALHSRRNSCFKVHLRFYSPVQALFIVGSAVQVSTIDAKHSQHYLYGFAVEPKCRIWSQSKKAARKPRDKLVATSNHRLTMAVVHLYIPTQKWPLYQISWVIAHSQRGPPDPG